MPLLHYVTMSVPWLSMYVCMLQAPFGSPPDVSARLLLACDTADVSARLLRACDMAAGGQQQQ